jgi:hypothetical protein
MSYVLPVGLTQHYQRNGASLVCLLHLAMYTHYVLFTSTLVSWVPFPFNTTAVEATTKQGYASLEQLQRGVEQVLRMISRCIGNPNPPFSSGLGLWLVVRRSQVRIPLSVWDFVQVFLPQLPHFTGVWPFRLKTISLHPGVTGEPSAGICISLASYDPKRVE